MGERHIKLDHEDLRCCSYISKATKFAKRLAILLVEEENKEQHHGGNCESESVVYNVGVGSPKKCIEYILLVAKSFVFLLSSKKNFVSHLAAKSLLALSDQLLNIPHAWMLLIELMWDAVKSWSSKLDAGQESQVLDSNVYRVKTIITTFKSNVLTDDDVFTFMKVIESKWAYYSGGSVHNASQVMFLFKRILKSCLAKHPSCSNSMQSFIGTLEQNLTQIVIQTLALQTDQIINEKGLMLGASLQLLCSVARVLAPDPWVDKGSDLHSHDSVLKSLNNLLPMIARDPLAQEMGCRYLYSGSVFLRSKMLMLEVRLSVWFKSLPELAACSLVVLQSCARDLLKICLLHTETSAIDFECFSSPFASCFANNLDSKMIGNQVFCLEKHLCRRAIFLLIKIYHTLSYDTKKEESNFESTMPAIEITPNFTASQRKEFSRQAGAALLGWIHIQLQPVWKIGNSGEFRLLEDSGNKLQKFTLHLVHLYLDEDILLLEMLLLLLDFVDLLSSLKREAIFPLSAIGHIFEDSFSHYDKLHNLVMEAFAPLPVFHAFLAWLRYDVTVLVDFLISENTGVFILQYLLRCLHLVIETWPSFLESPFGRGSAAPEKSANEQKCSQNFGGSAVQYNQIEQKCDVLRSEEQGCSTMEASTSAVRKRKSGDLEETRACSPVSIEDDEDDSVCSESQNMHLPQIFPEQAMQCLLGLRKSIERCHGKKLFPYNPSALVSRLKSVERLCRGNW